MKTPVYWTVNYDTTDLESVSTDAHLAMTVSTKFEVDTTIRCLIIALLLLIRYVTLLPWPLTFWLWSVVIHGGSRGQPLHQVWRSYVYPFLSYNAKRVKTRSLQEWVCHFELKFQGEGVVPGEYFLVSTKLDTFLLSNSANCTVLRAVVLTQCRRVTDRRTDGQTELP